jgi:arylsulfatase
MPGTPADVLPIAFSSYAGTDIGSDNSPGCLLEYEPKAPCAFTGTAEQVVFELKPAPRHDDEQAQQAAAHLHRVAEGVAA